MEEPPAFIDGFAPLVIVVNDRVGLVKFAAAFEAAQGRAEGILGQTPDRDVRERLGAVLAKLEMTAERFAGHAAVKCDAIERFLPGRALFYRNRVLSEAELRAMWDAAGELSEPHTTYVSRPAPHRAAPSRGQPHHLG